MCWWSPGLESFFAVTPSWLANENGEAKLPAGHTIRLEMAGLWVPGDASPQLRFFDPTTGGPKPAPEEILRFQPPAIPNSPILRLVFSGSGTNLWNRTAQVFDSRTHHPVGRVIDVQKRGKPVLDVPLEIWHDTPLGIVLRLPCGVRFQFIATGPGTVREVGRRGETWDITPSGQRFILGRVSPAVWAANCRFRNRDSGDPAPWSQPAWFERVPRIQAAHHGSKLPLSRRVRCRKASTADAMHASAVASRGTVGKTTGSSKSGDLLNLRLQIALSRSGKMG